MSLYDEGKALIYDYEYFNRDMELTNEFNDRVEKGEYISEEEQSVYNYATDRVMQYNVLLGKSNTNVWERYAEKNQQYNDFKGGYSQQATDGIDSVDAVTGRIPEMNNGQNVASGNVVSAPSGSEWYDREWRAIKTANPDWTDNQVTAKMSETVWNNNYKELMDDIAHSSSPEEREQKIREHQSELDNYKASGIDVDNDEQYLRDTQGMPSESIFNKLVSAMSNFSSEHVDPQDIVSPESLAFGEIPKGISLQKTTDLQIQKKEEEDKVYEAHAQQFKEFVEKVQETPGWDSTMGYLHGLFGADGSYENRSGEYKFGWNLSNNAVSKLISAAAKVVETAPPVFPGRGPMLSSELVTGGAIARSTTTNLPANIYFSSSKGNEASTSNSERTGNLERPSWRQSEKDVSTANSDYETQKSFKNGQEVSYGTKGSVRPDNYKEGASIEVKNYNVTTTSGQNRLVDNITKQVEQRLEHLPADTRQKVVIDVRGQNVSNDILREIRNSIVSKTGENVEIQFLR